MTGSPGNGPFPITDPAGTPGSGRRILGEEFSPEQVAALDWLGGGRSSAARWLCPHGRGGPGVPDVIAAGFSHRQGGSGTGFEAGGPLDVMLPGAQLGAQVARARGDLRALNDDALIGMLAANRRQLSWHQQTEYELIAELDRRRARPDGAEGEHVDAELAAALTETPRSAQALLEYARQLERLAPTAALLAAGVLDPRRAQVIARHLESLSDKDAAAVQDAVLPRAGDMTSGRLGDVLKTAIRTIDPEAARKRREKARQDARVECWGEDSGTASLAGRNLPPAQTIAADKKIRAAAKWLKDHDAEGTLEQISARVFLALLNGQPLYTLLPDRRSDPAGAAGSGSAGRPGEPASAGWPAGLAGSVHLTMPVSAWFGGSQAPGQISGYGAADADTCRELASQLAQSPVTRWCITLTDRCGRAVGHGCARAGPGPPNSSDPRSWLANVTIYPIETGTCLHRRQTGAYQVPDSLRHLIKIRSPRCGFPGCRRPAVRCDDDHTIPHHLGGRSCECNLYPLCRRHHRCKQSPGWHLQQPQPGHLTWTAPSGRSYITTAEPYPV
jgi:hypothetical protein